ncbi:MAG: bifunctional oligoribonuclease/PAP phosphatase NrnA [Candidatus Tantalella remota]|nr:bifunctional oligoribonuclease/PAP phosphatase NrnA [Candidatus Tantalella remota]
MNKEDLKKVIEAIKERDSFLITAHVNPEGDSIGSQLAMWGMLTKMGKKAVLVDQDDVPYNIKFLSGSGLVGKSVPEGFNVETVLILDCPVRERIGSLGGDPGEKTFTINIDHHVSNEFFADVNWVDPAASSVGEMVYVLAKEAGVEMDKDLAECLYAAIVTDTGMFNYDNTSQRTHDIAGELIALGVSPKKVRGEIYENKAVCDIRILGKVLSTLQLEGEGRVAHISLTAVMYAEEGADVVSTDEFINYPRAVKGVEVAVFFKESPVFAKKVNVSFRSKGKTDVNRIASVFGGGGHPQASGCVLDCGLEEARKKVLKETVKMLG